MYKYEEVTHSHLILEVCSKAVIWLLQYSIFVETEKVKTYNFVWSVSRYKENWGHVHCTEHTKWWITRLFAKIRSSSLLALMSEPWFPFCSPALYLLCNHQNYKTRSKLQLLYIHTYGGNVILDWKEIRAFNSVAIIVEKLLYTWMYLKDNDIMSMEYDMLTRAYQQKLKTDFQSNAVYVTFTYL